MVVVVVVVVVEVHRVPAVNRDSRHRMTTLIGPAIDKTHNQGKRKVERPAGQSRHHNP